MDKNKFKTRIDNLDELAYHVTQENGTEKPFENEYDQNFEPGIYLDKISKKVLFYSKDKFDSGCGWPAFAQPADAEEIIYQEDNSIPNRKRIEVRSKTADSHLGHVFDDGPEELGGKRYCINSASLIFIPLSKLAAEGYEEYLKYFTD